MEDEVIEFFNSMLIIYTLYKYFILHFWDISNAYFINHLNYNIKVTTTHSLYTMKFASYNLLEHENYIRENNLNKIIGLNLFCCHINFYKNANYYFDCYCYKSNHTQQ